jgi:hypothetical protein
MKRLVLSMSILAVACGDDGGEDPTTNGDTQESGDDDSNTMTDPSADDDDDDDGSSSVTLDDGSSSSGGSSDDGSTSSADSSGTDGSSGSSDSSGEDPTGNPVELEVELTDPQAWQDCMPIVPPDPLNLSVTLEFDNPGLGIGTADVTAARLSSGGVEVISFDVSPASFGPFDPDDMTISATTKVDGSASPQNGCETVECGGEYDLEIVFDVEGTEVIGTTTVTVECVF